MAAPLKWFPFYIDDWEFDEAVRLMSHEERGIYVALLCWQWREGTVPHDARKVAAVLRARIASVRVVLGRGFKDDGTHTGRLTNPRLAELRVNQLTRAGKASASARGWKTTEERFLYAAEATIERRMSDNRSTLEKQIKIGWSRNPRARIAGISRESRRRLVLIGMRAATISLERKAHEDLALHREEGEWFRDVPAVRQWLDTNGVTGNTAGNTTGVPDGTTSERSRIRSEIQKSLGVNSPGNGKGNGDDNGGTPQ